MNEDCILVRRNDSTASDCEAILFNGINQESARVKGLNPIQTFCFSIENSQNEVCGGINGITYYGCLYIDMLWINSRLREKGWGTKLMQEAENLGKKEGCSFATVNTMDWEALSFYEKLGYRIEFIREGYEKNSKMYLLRKEL